MEDQLIDLYNELLLTGIKEDAYFKLIKLMDSMKINRDFLETPIFVSGIVKFPVHIYRDGYDIDYCDWIKLIS